jgi:hypothetical protein
VLLVVLFWIAIFLIVMRSLTWIAKRHPKARDAAAFVIECCAALAVAEAVADLAAVASGSQASAAVVLNALLFALIGCAAHFFASNTAHSPLVVGIPFVLVGVGVVAGVFTPPLRLFVGVALVALGGIFGWLKLQSTKGPAGPKASGEAAQA